MSPQDTQDTGEIFNDELTTLINERRRLLADLNENASRIDDVLRAMSLAENMESEPCTPE